MSLPANINKIITVKFVVSVIWIVSHQANFIPFHTLSFYVLCQLAFNLLHHMSNIYGYFSTFIMSACSFHGSVVAQILLVFIKYFYRMQNLEFYYSTMKKTHIGIFMHIYSSGSTNNSLFCWITKRWYFGLVELRFVCVCLCMQICAYKKGKIVFIH